MPDVPDPKKKKRKRRYVDILKVPLEKLTGWQEVGMDSPRLDEAMEFARTRPVPSYFRS